VALLRNKSEQNPVFILAASVICSVIWFGTQFLSTSYISQKGEPAGAATAGFFMCESPACHLQQYPDKSETDNLYPALLVVIMTAEENER
jgi:hypothetical protein